MPPAVSGLLRRVMKALCRWTPRRCFLKIRSRSCVRPVSLRMPRSRHAAHLARVAPARFLKIRSRSRVRPVSLRMPRSRHAAHLARVAPAFIRPARVTLASDRLTHRCVFTSVCLMFTRPHGGEGLALLLARPVLNLHVSFPTFVCLVFTRLHGGEGFALLLARPVLNLHVSLHCYPLRGGTLSWEVWDGSLFAGTIIPNFLAAIQSVSFLTRPHGGEGLALLLARPVLNLHARGGRVLPYCWRDLFTTP